MNVHKLVIVALVSVLIVGCAARERAARPAHEPMSVAYLQANELDSFEMMGEWSADSAGDPVQLSLSVDHVTSGSRSLQVDYFAAGAGKLMLHRHEKLDLSKASRIAIDVFNDGPPGDLAIGFQTLPGWRYYETPRVTLKTGWNRGVRFDIATKRFSIDAGTYTSWLADRQQVGRLTLVFFAGTAQDSTLHFDGLRFDRQVSDVLLGVPPSGLRVTASDTAVNALEKLELDVSFSASFQNPFDTDDVHVFATFVAPSGKRYVVDGFTHEILTKEPLIGAQWKVRFTPSESGRWIYDVGVRNKFGESYSEREYFTCTTETEPRGFVRRSRAAPGLFEYDSGEFFYPIGQNVAWAQDFNRYFDAVEGYGGNLVRVWLCSWGLALDVPKEPGKIDLKQAGRVDEMIEQAEGRGLHILLCLYTHGELTFGWEKNPLNRANGGPCATAGEFFTAPEARRLFEQRLRYAVARWGYNPTLFAWELGNEMDVAPGGTSDEGLAWMQQMLRTLRALDPYDRLLTTSVVSFPLHEKLLKERALDFLSPHLYRPDAPRALADLQDQLPDDDRPFLVAEYGRGWTADVDLADPKGQALHGALWSSFMSPAAGAPMPWWWDVLIEPKGLYRHFASLAKFAKDEDRREMNLLQFRRVLTLSEENEVSLIGLMNDHMLYGYCYDEQAGLHPARKPLPLLPAEAEIKIEGFLDGEYFVEVWNTYAGEIIHSSRAEAVDGLLTLRLPAAESDFAIKVKKTGYRHPSVETFELAEPAEF